MSFAPMPLVARHSEEGLLLQTPCINDTELASSVDTGEFESASELEAAAETTVAIADPA
jgi:hypothetical protein